MLMWAMSRPRHPAQPAHDGGLRRPHLPLRQRARRERISSSSTGSPSSASTAWPGTRRRRSPARTRTSTGATCGRRSTRGDFPEWELGVQMIPQDKEHALRLRPARPDQADARRDGAGAAHRQAGAQPQPRQLLCRDRAGRLPSGPRGAGHRLHATTRCCRGGCSRTPTRSSRAWAAPNFHELPINQQRVPVPQLPARRHAPPDRSRAARWPTSRNSLANGSGVPRRWRRARASSRFPRRSSRPRCGAAAPASTTTSRQARLFFNSQSAAEKEHIIAAFRFELSKVEVPAIRQRMVDNLAHVDEKLARRVAEPLGIGAPDAQGRGRPRRAFASTGCKLPIEESPALSMVDTGDGSMQARARWRSWWPTASIRPRSSRSARRSQQAGAQCKVVGPRLGTVASASRRQLEVDATFANMPSVMFDAVLVPAGAQGAEALARNGDAVHFVLEAYKHCKAICTVGEGVQLLATLGIGADAKAPGRRGGGRDAGHQPRRQHRRPADRAGLHRGDREAPALGPGEHRRRSGLGLAFTVPRAAGQRGARAPAKIVTGVVTFDRRGYNPGFASVNTA